jgi:predicted nucleic acid-binding protein
MAADTRYLLDTNVLSEAVRARPDPQVMAWLDSLNAEQLFVSVLSLAEIRKGALMAAASRQEKLLQWANVTLPHWFDDRVLAVDIAVADEWATMLAQAVHQKLPAIDSLIAATALHHGLTVATRNLKDFDRMDASVYSPWSFSA